MGDRQRGGREMRVVGNKRGGGAYSFVVRLSILTIDHAYLQTERRGGVLPEVRVVAGDAARMGGGRHRSPLRGRCCCTPW